MKTTFQLLLSLAFFVISSCKAMDHSAHRAFTPLRDEFYTDAFYYGDPRLPLVKPYYLGNASHDLWIGSSISDEQQGGIMSVKQIAVYSNTILIYSSYPVSIHGTSLPRAWFVIHPEQHIELGFKREDAFKQYVIEHGISEIKWENVDATWEIFRDTGTLPWQTELPGSAKSH